MLFWISSLHLSTPIIKSSNHTVSIKPLKLLWKHANSNKTEPHNASKNPESCIDTQQCASQINVCKLSIWSITHAHWLKSPVSNSQNSNRQTWLRFFMFSWSLRNYYSPVIGPFMLQDTHQNIFWSFISICGLMAEWRERYCLKIFKTSCFWWTVIIQKYCCYMVN